MRCSGVRKRRHPPGRAGGAAGGEGVTGEGGGFGFSSAVFTPRVSIPGGRTRHPQRPSPSPRGAKHPTAALQWVGGPQGAGGHTRQLRTSCGKLSFQDKADQQLEDLQEHRGCGWEGGTAGGGGVPPLGGGTLGQHGDRAGDAPGTRWPLRAWLSGAARGENADLDFSVNFVVGGESREGLAVVVVPAGGHQADVLLGAG